MAAPTRQKVAVQLRDRGWPHTLDRHVADARCDVEPDTSSVVQQGPRLDLHRVAVDPLIEVCGDRDLVAVDVRATASLHACLVAGRLGVFLGGESGDPPRPAHASLGVLDPDHIGPCAPAFHDAVAELPCTTAAAPTAGWLVGGVGRDGGSHHAAVPSARSLEMYSSRAASGMRRDPSMRDRGNGAASQQLVELAAGDRQRLGCLGHGQQEPGHGWPPSGGLGGGVPGRPGGRESYGG
jgi:hypothetical protein